MKTLEINQMENLNGGSDSDDLMAGIVCGAAVGAWFIPVVGVLAGLAMTRACAGAALHALLNK